jgi:ferritin
MAEERNMLSENMLGELNKQVNEELYSAYLYQSMAAFADSEGYKGTSVWLDNQAQEEMIHARKIYDFILERGGKVKLLGIEEPPEEFGKILEIFEASLKHEEHITGRINHLVSIARDEKDYATDNFLQWFVGEQVEEESTVQDILDKLYLIGDHPGGIFQLDRELGTRGPPQAEE